MKIPKQDPTVCKQKDNAAFGIDCAGPMFESRGYFTDGQSLYVCEAHAKATMELNPFGATFVKVER